MTHQQQATNRALFTLALLSMMFGMVLFEMTLLVDQIPAWALLPVFFGVGTLCKFILVLHRQALSSTKQMRIVTVEFDWPFILQETQHGSYV